MRLRRWLLARKRFPTQDPDPLDSFFGRQMWTSTFAGQKVMLDAAIARETEWVQLVALTGSDRKARKAQREITQRTLRSPLPREAMFRAYCAEYAAHPGISWWRRVLRRVRRMW